MLFSLLFLNKFKQNINQKQKDFFLTYKDLFNIQDLTQSRATMLNILFLQKLRLNCLASENSNVLKTNAAYKYLQAYVIYLQYKLQK